jgi:peptidoglycan/xylan/chitin deacetylase (PgdA/CDA1 family)
MLKRLIKVAVSALVRAGDLLMDGGRRLLGRPSPARGVVLYYHAVRPELGAAFARQMDLLLRRARPWRAETTVPPGSGRHVAVTFDDGYASVVAHAFPELKRRDIPFTIFFPTGSWNARPAWVREPAHPFFHERVLSREELRTLAAEPLVTVGSHSINHPNFLRLDAAAAEREFRESKHELEALLGRPVELFSFPHGAHNEELVRQARASGYRRVFTILPEQVDPAAPGFKVGRVAVEPDDWSLEFRLKLAGAYRWQAVKSGKRKAESGKPPIADH